MAMTNTIIVSQYSDLEHTDLYDRDKNVLIEYYDKLEYSAQNQTIVVFIPEWLTEEKELECLTGSKYLFTGTIESETDKAVLLSQSGSEDWLPKSQITVFERAETFSAVTPQRRFEDYCE